MQLSKKRTEKPSHCIAKRPKLTNDVSVETKAYPEFMFRHKFSLLVVGPTQCGKTFFVEKILTTDRILYESKKPRRIWWYYSQWQDTYKVMQSSIGKEIQFFRGLPEFKEDLREIDPKFNNVLVFDDLMAQATDSRLASLLGLLKGGIEMLVYYFCYKICFQRENLTRTSARMISTWLFSDVLLVDGACNKTSR